MKRFRLTRGSEYFTGSVIPTTEGKGFKVIINAYLVPDGPTGEHRLLMVNGVEADTVEEVFDIVNQIAANTLNAVIEWYD